MHSRLFFLNVKDVVLQRSGYIIGEQLFLKDVVTCANIWIKWVGERRAFDWNATRAIR